MLSVCGSTHQKCMHAYMYIQSYTYINIYTEVHIQRAHTLTHRWGVDMLFVVGGDGGRWFWCVCVCACACTCVRIKKRKERRKEKTTPLSVRIHTVLLPLLHSFPRTNEHSYACTCAWPTQATTVRKLSVRGVKKRVCTLYTCIHTYRQAHTLLAQATRAPKPSVHSVMKRA